MEIQDIFLLYSFVQPNHYECKDTSHENDDFRLAIFAEWPDKKIVIKIGHNYFTTPKRIQGWHDLIEEYRQAGYYCPRILPMKNGELSMNIEYAGRPCAVFAEEFSEYQTAEQLGETIKQGSRYPYHDDAIISLGVMASKHLKTVNWPSGYSLFEPFDPSDGCDETMEAALKFKKYMEESFSEHKIQFSRIWEKFMANRDRLEQIYGQLPTSVFQADLNTSNILIKEDLNFAGMLDFNLCGRETILNMVFREFIVNFGEDVPEDEENKRYYSEKINRMAVDSLFHNISLMKRAYSFTKAEKTAALFLYRTIRPFWWDTFHEIYRVRENKEKIIQLLDWMENELTREDLDFEKVMD